MFERFTPESRDVVVGAQEECRSLGHPAIDTSHLLLSVLAGTSPTAALLRARGVTRGRALEALSTVRSAPTPPDVTTRPDADDVAALAALGVDFERVRASLEASFGPGALERVSPRPRLCWSGGLSSLLTSRRPGALRGGHLPFGPEAKAALELSLREALRLGDGGIAPDHLLLGLLCGEGTTAVEVLACLEVDPAVLRRDVETGRRRSA